MAGWVGEEGVESGSRGYEGRWRDARISGMGQGCNQRFLR